MNKHAGIIMNLLIILIKNIYTYILYIYIYFKFFNVHIIFKLL